MATTKKKVPSNDFYLGVWMDGDLIDSVDIGHTLKEMKGYGYVIKVTLPKHQEISRKYPDAEINLA